MNLLLCVTGMCVCIVFPQVGVVVDLVVFQVVAKVKGCILLFRPDHTHRADKGHSAYCYRPTLKSVSPLQDM